MSDALTLADLSEQSGIPARTIRFYIARGLLDGPVKAGRGAVYTGQHLERIAAIQKLQAEGRMLAEIAGILNGQPAAASPPVAWWQQIVHDDVMVWVRGDVSPWRMRQIRAAIDELAARIAGPANSNQRSPRK